MPAVEDDLKPTPHDEAFKKLLQRFFWEFIELFSPSWIANWITTLNNALLRLIRSIADLYFQPIEEEELILRELLEEFPWMRCAKQHRSNHRWFIKIIDTLVWHKI
ncbi:MAG: hypothetical protein K0R75_2852 [Paenibacillaceae bacterium]|nr:hypothetical protein [Paenibacillaceae bacterium]